MTVTHGVICRDACNVSREFNLCVSEFRIACSKLAFEYSEMSANGRYEKMFD